MPRVVALYRYPVKGFTPEACVALNALPEGRIAWDRVLGFRFADSSAPGGAWSRKHEFVALANTPGLARLDLRFNHRALRLRIIADGDVLVDGGLDPESRVRIAAAVAGFVLGLEENPLSGHPGRLPLNLVGDGVTPRFQDSEAGQITLHSRESLAAVAAAAGDPALDERRFRSNVVIEGVDAWDEQQWIGRGIRIGDVRFEVVRPKTRCLATHANPATGRRDLPLMKTLVTAFGQGEPTFAVAIVPRGPVGAIRIGDEVDVI